MKIIVLIFVFVPLIGLGFYINSDVNLSTRSVKEILKDPDSAKFSNVRKTSQYTVCGKVNSRNGFGAYAGNKRFIVLESDHGERTPMIEDKSNLKFFNDSWEIICDKTR